MAGGGELLLAFLPSSPSMMSCWSRFTVRVLSGVDDRLPLPLLSLVGDVVVEVVCDCDCDCWPAMFLGFFQVDDLSDGL